MYSRLQRNLKLLSGKPDFWIAVVAGLVYSSWPLGFILNPFVAHHDFASELESPHQPYNWVFIALDITSGLLMIFIGLRQWRRAGSHVTLRLSVVAYALFAILVIAAAVAPDNCASSAVHACQALVRTPAFIIHGLSSIVSVVFLLLSLLLPAKILLQQRMYHWAVLMAVFVLAGWGLTGLGTLLVMADGARSNWLQYEFITICSLTLVGCFILVDRLSGRTPQPNRRETDRDPVAR